MLGTYVIHYPGAADSLTPVPLAPGEQYAAPPPQPRPAGEAVEDLDQALRRLAQLRDDGLITGEEYEEKRQALLKRV